MSTEASPRLHFQCTSHKCGRFYNRLSNLLSGKRDIPPLVAINWIRTKIKFALFRFLNRNIATIGDDVQFLCEVSKIP